MISLGNFLSFCIFVLLMHVQYLLASGQIDILANFDIAQNFVPDQLLKQEGFELRDFSFPRTFENYLHSDYTLDVRKVIIMGWIIPESRLSKIPKEKLFFFTIRTTRNPAAI